MNLLTVGDSFTYGEELADLKSAWPFLLGNKLNYSVSNMAKPATGNTYMVRTVVENFINYDLIIIAWSHFARVEFADSFGIFDTWPGHRNGIFTNNHQDHRNQLSGYLTRYHNDEYLYFQYLINIILLQNFLKQKNKKYLMIDAFGNNYGDFIHINKIKNLREQIDCDYYVGWPDDTMMEITYTCPQGPGGHFLDEGHQLVADKIYEHIRHLSWIS
jgi:hypothetical protein